MKRKFTCLVLVIFISVYIQGNVIGFEQLRKSTQIILNNREIVFNSQSGYPFIDKQDIVIAPLRPVVEAIGAKVSWDKENRSVDVFKDDILVRIPIGKQYFYRNDRLIPNTKKAQIIDGRAYLPIQAVLEAFHCKVSWSENKSILYISFENRMRLIQMIPKSYDLRDYNKVTDVKDQKDIGACWSFATLGAIESVLMPKENFDFSEDHMSLTHGYNVPQDKGGDFNITMAYLARWGGPIYEWQDPYGDGKTTNTKKAVKHIQEARVLPSKDYNAIKLSILLYGGVQTSMYFDEALIESKNTIYNENTHSFYYKGNAKLNHAVVIVGWDDRFPKESFAIQPEGDGAFICKNSFGDKFGDGGYFYVSYYDRHIGTENVVYTRIENVDNRQRIYQTDKLGWIGRLGYGEDTGYFANAYSTGGRKENLEAVSFYATDDNSSYEVFVVEDFKNKDSFKKMRLVEEGDVKYKGYYTVSFPVPIQVEGKFAVVVKIKTPGSSMPVAAEYYKKVDWLSEVDISDGEGYISQDGRNWDRTELQYSSNVCLKAFTKTTF